jgi:fermentation-respiration switch protein FrsA (DUF1100 family)
MKMELVTFHSQNQRIFGNLHLPRDGSSCVVTLHGLESNKDSGKWPIIAERLCDEGYACLRFNFQGCGKGSEKSEGFFEDVTLTRRIVDFKSALDFLQDTEKVDMWKLGVVGSSFGGMVAIAAQDRRVKAIVTMATPYKILRRERTQIPKEAGGYYELPSGARFKIGFYEDLRKYDLIEAVRNAPPIAILHGNSDEIVPLEHAKKLYEAAPEPKRLEIIEDADHVFSQNKHLNKVIDLTLEWFKKYLD